MSFPVDLVNLVLYCAQQLGVMLGVGAQSVLLIVYFLSLRSLGGDPHKAEQFVPTVHKVLGWGLVFIVSSGLLITAVHLFIGQFNIVFSPAFVLKWLLIAAVSGVEIVRRRHAPPHFVWEGLAGAHWYALFALHILAPVAAWGDLLVLYVLWVAGFMVCFVSVAHAMSVPVSTHTPTQPVPPPQPKKVVHPPPRPAPKPAPKPPEPAKPLPPEPAPKPAPSVQIKIAPPVLPAVVPEVPHKPHLAQVPAPMAVPHKPIVVVPPLPHKPQNQIPIPQKPAPPAPRKHRHFGLPAIRVMPRSKEDVDNQLRASAVQLEEAQA